VQIFRQAEPTAFGTGTQLIAQGYKPVFCFGCKADRYEQAHKLIISL
jgi:hypothetical protein